MRNAPPRLADWLIRLLTRSPVREDILGDLHEEFASRMQRSMHPARVRAWYWRQAISVRSIRARTPSTGRNAQPQRERMRSYLDQVTRDVRHAVRALRRAPVFTVVAALTLALGIGANTAIFSVVYTVLLRPLPLIEEEGLVAVWLTAPGLELEQLDHTEVTYALFRDRARSFAHLAVVDGRSMNLTGQAEPVRLQIRSVSSSFFPTVGVAPIMGRAWAPEEDALGAADVAVLSYGTWQRHFGSDPDVLGRAIVLDGAPHEIIGVMPQGLNVPSEDFDVLVPHRLDPST